MNSNMDSALEAAVAASVLLPSSLTNIKLLLAGTSNPIALPSIQQLVEEKNWQELNDRFYKTLAFGTGGLRGRTIGKTITDAEQGKGGINDRPEFPCIGTACMNEFNIGRAMRGLIIYISKFLASQGETRKPRIVIGCDTRHFSADFAQYCAKIAADLGCDAYLFDGARSTPQVSFAIRELNADTGIVLTASHNPSHDNGFKAYFNDGAQLIAPHDKAVIAEVNALTSESYEALPPAERGSISILGDDFDRIYMDRLKSIIQRPEVFHQSCPRIVYTNLHGTGGHLIVPMLREMGCEVITVAEQDIQDGRFPTVSSPNPENPPALAMGIALADKIKADIVIATDPDADRIGIALRDSSGAMRLLTGNQTGCLLAWYRCMSMIDLGWLNKESVKNSVMIKTFVTSPLQDAIAQSFGINVVNVLTGFKYIAAKLGKYEQAIPAELRRNYRQLGEAETRALRLAHSKYFVIGGEESYGYLAQDFVRDKDANAAALLIAELAAYAILQGKLLTEILDDIYSEHGVYIEEGKSLVMEGADGAAQIAALATSYSSNPPTEMDGTAVSGIRDFSLGKMIDAEGDPIPAEGMLFVDLADGRSFAVRPSGTEPKIKYYLFAHGVAGADIPSSTSEVKASLASLWACIESDAKARM